MPTVTSATELEALEITGAAGVRRGANRAQFGADGWALMKADGTPLGGPMPTPTKTAKDDVTPTPEPAPTDPTPTPEPTPAPEPAPEPNPAPADPAPAPADDIAKAMESLPESVRKAIEDQIGAAKNEAAEASKIAKAERDARLTNEFVAKAETFAALPGKAATFGPVLRSVAEQCDPLVALELDRVLRAYDEQVRTGELFKSAGNDGQGDTSAYAQLEAHAAELRKSDTSLTKDQAITLASEQRPDLVDAHRTEQKGR